MTIDMKTFAGVTEDSAAGNQQSSNSYSDEYPVYTELLDPPSASQPDEKHQEAPADQVASESTSVSEPSDKEINFRALRDEIASLKQQKDELEANFRLLRQNQIERQEPPRMPQNEQKKMFEDVADDDYPTASQIRNAWEQREVEYLARINELQTAQAHPDYEEVINKYTLPLLQQKPHLAAALQDPRTRVSVAYDLGRMAMQQEQVKAPAPVQTPPSVIAQKIVENSKKPGTLSSAGGQTVLSKADYYASMSDQEFISLAKANLDGI